MQTWCGTCDDSFLTKHGFGLLPEKRGENATRGIFRIGYLLSTAVFCIAILVMTPNALYIVDCALVFVAQVVRIIFHRSLLAISETRYKKGRYNNKKEMVIECFSGIDWLNVAAFLFGSVIVIFICLYRVTDSEITGKHIFKAFGAIEFGTMLVYFLDLDGQSTVEHSIVAEDKQLHPAITLAYQYCFNRLLVICRVLNRTFWEQDHGLSSTKLFILFPLTSDGKDPEHIDRKIKRVDTPELPGNLNKESIPVYRIGSFTVMLELAAPLSTLHKMSERKISQAVDKDNLKEHVRSLYRTVKDILEACGESANCVLIPYDDKALSSGLAYFLQTVVFPAHVEKSNSSAPGNEDTMPRGVGDGNMHGDNVDHGAGNGGPDNDGDGSRSLGKPKDCVTPNDTCVVQIENISPHVGAGPHVSIGAGRRSHAGPAETSDDGDLNDDNQMTSRGTHDNVDIQSL